MNSVQREGIGEGKSAARDHLLQKFGLNYEEKLVLSFVVKVHLKHSKY